MAVASQIKALIKGYLVDLEIPYQEAQDGSVVRVLIGSTAVYIRSYQWGEHTVVGFEAPVLTGVKDDAPVALLPMLNRELYFAKFGFDENNDTVTVDYELLAEHMDVDEFYNAMRPSDPSRTNGTTGSRRTLEESYTTRPPKMRSSEFRMDGRAELPDLVEQVAPSVVHVTTDDGHGSGFAIGDKGRVVTNAHVIDGSDEPILKLSAGERAPARVLGVDASTDLALLELPDSEVPP